MTIRNRIALGLEHAAAWVRGETLARVTVPGQPARDMHVDELLIEPNQKITPAELEAYFGPILPIGALEYLTEPWVSMYSITETRLHLREYASKHCTDINAEPNTAYTVTLHDGSQQTIKTRSFQNKLRLPRNHLRVETLIAAPRL